MKLPRQVKMVEVGPRDGLQNETRTVPTHIKIALIEKLVETGLKTVEATSFVSPKRIPQMGDHSEVLNLLKRKPGVSYPVLVPNIQGLEGAIAAGAEEIAIFGAASETFSKRNINCTIAESLMRFKDVIAMAKQHHLKIRGYISCVLGCPYEGFITPEKVAELAEQLYLMGCYEISLGDTIGVGTIPQTQKLIQKVTERIPTDITAVHFHDTYGQALANIYAAISLGVHIVDSSVAGLGGCPYARGATGNVASEDVLYMLNGLEIDTGVSIEKLAQAGQFISDYLERPNGSKAGTAILAKLI